jgi:hypothetical protein
LGHKTGGGEHGGKHANEVDEMHGAIIRSAN